MHMGLLLIIYLSEMVIPNVLPLMVRLTEMVKTWQVKVICDLDLWPKVIQTSSNILYYAELQLCQIWLNYNNSVKSYKMFSILGENVSFFNFPF